MPKQNSTTKSPLGANFNKLWSASVASNFADGMLKTAAPLLAASLTQDPVLISLMSALVMLPWLLFAIPVGALVDRVNRRLALATANATRFLIAGFLAYLVTTGGITIWWLFLATFLIGIAEVVYDTTTQSMVPQLVAKENMNRANSRLQAAEVLVAEFLGSPLSGILYAIAIAIPFYVNSVGLIVAVVLVLLVPASFAQTLADQPKTQESERVGFWADVRFGIKYLLGHKTLLKLALVSTMIGFAFTVSQATLVLYLLNVQGVPVAAFGFVTTSFGIGALVGSISAPKLGERFGSGRVLAAVNVAAGVLMTLLAVAPNVWIVVLMFVLIGAVSSTWNVLLMSVYHKIIPNHLFGRIHGTRRTLVWGTMPIGSLLGGLIAAIDLRLPFLVGGLVATLLAIWYIRFLVEVGD